METATSDLTMNSTTRVVHDLHAGLHKALGRRLKVSESAPPTALRETGSIQSAGSCTLDNSLEADFYGLPEKTITYSWQDASCFRLKHAYVVGDQGHVFLKDGSFFLPCIHPQEHLLKLMKIRRPVKSLAKKIKGPVFHLTGRNHENRGHFLLQHLPRILAAREVLERIGDYRILVAPGHSRWQKALLDLAGFDPGRVIEGTQGTLETDDLIFVPQLYGSNSLVAPELCRAIRDCAAALPLERPDGPSIFISRQDAPDKRLENEPAIVAAAREILGELEVVELRKFSLKEQIAKYRQAPVILGPIGQGLCNVVFTSGKLFISLKPGLTVDDYIRPGHTTHTALVCGNHAINFFSNTPAPSRGNWSFPEERFRRQLTDLLESPQLTGIASQLKLSP